MRGRRLGVAFAELRAAAKEGQIHPRKIEGRELENPQLTPDVAARLVGERPTDVVFVVERMQFGAGELARAQLLEYRFTDETRGAHDGYARQRGCGDRQRRLRVITGVALTTSAHWARNRR